MRNNVIAAASVALALTAFGMQLHDALSAPQPVVIYCQPVCEMP